MRVCSACVIIGMRVHSRELRHDVGLRAASLVHQLHRGVQVGEAEAPLHTHPVRAVRLRNVRPERGKQYQKSI